MSDIRICFFGDSFVNGTGDPAYLGWTGRACAAATSSQHSLTHYNLGIRGNTSQQIENRWQMESNLRFLADGDSRLVFSFGVNDTRLEAGAVLVDPNTAITTARRLLIRAKAQYPTLLVGPPPIEDPAANIRIKQTSDAYRELCAELEVPYLETYQPLSQNLIWMQEVAMIDGAHPAASGYEALASLVSKWTAWQSWFA
ncbi:MAG: lipase [Leptolyngbya foveolarum]|uniref:Lipase n=1 Tax=Leptolyngbya foveolarum TaxID=47253 RepID=A0A2W4W578_9CYAN|nr:MAG: lipase [Leptolyngbya foveolarum]